MKLKIYKTFFIILILIIIVLSVLIVIKYRKSYLNEQENKEVLEVFSKEISNIENLEENNENEVNIKINGYKVIGIVKIPKINIEYPILDIDTYNPSETKEPLKYSIVKYWGNSVNEYGNLSIAGHNNYDGTMFGKTKKLRIGDLVELTDLNNKTIQYSIHNVFKTDPNDVSILETNNQNIREVTLITCTNGNRQRLIIKAKEVI